jgi:hypothetical protein
MNELFKVTAPLVIRLPQGKKKLIAEKFPHAQGLLYFDLYWHELEPAEAFHTVRGEITGEGPWKIADSVITVLGCEGTDPELSSAWSDWQAIIQSPVSDYPDPGLVAAIARKLGGMA